MMNSHRKSGLNRLVGMAAVAAVVAAVTKELRRPEDERTWHGEVAGFVPYDFRKPTLERVRERMWAPGDPNLVKPQVFGVGWTVNVGRVASLLQEKLSPPPPGSSDTAPAV
jgi:hypothetical protein